MLGLHFVPRVIPARPSFAHTKARRGAHLPVAQPFRGLITIQQRGDSASSRSAIPWADNYSAKGRLGIVTELVLGGPGAAGLGWAECLFGRLV